MGTYAPEDVDTPTLVACWRKLGGRTPPTPRQEARLRDVIAYAVDADRRRRMAAYTVDVSDPLRAEIKAAYLAGQSISQIAAWYGVSRITVRSHLLKMGVTMRPVGDRRRSP